jgi:hypothetical protein
MNTMKICLTCLVAMIALHVWGQGGNPRALGIGFAVAADPYQFEDGSRPSRLYRDPALKVPWTGREVAPFFNKADYGLYHFMCLAKTETYYKVLVNDHDVAYLPADDAFHFMTWEQLMIGYPMERHSTDNPIYERPSTSSKRVHHACDPDRLYVKLLVERKGEYWAYVAMPLDCEDHPDLRTTPCKVGWVKWRTQTELLVSILLLC